MRHKLFSASCIVAIAVIGAAPAYANPNPHNNSCQATEHSGGNTPGNAATSPGSVFNEPGINSPNGGKGGQAYNRAQASNKVGAAAQYDTACANTLKTGTGTPMQPTAAPTQIPNNSKDTRADNGVISHSATK
jgi:transcription elongation factor